MPHDSPYKIPDWREYSLDDAPELQKYAKRLAAHGLKDPWIRNDVWRYSVKMGYQSTQRKALKLVGTGSKWGISAALLCIAYDYLNRYKTTGSFKYVNPHHH
ncbi:hypothetical protein GJ496_010737 [Pomphorhynchus laevis]|nr:hypothetical protein GJ496_010737 [Pomphorhynchus laevis]